MGPGASAICPERAPACPVRSGKTGLGEEWRKIGGPSPKQRLIFGFWNDGRAGVAGYAMAWCGVCWV
jgi:hypothetical protein